MTVCKEDFRLCKDFLDFRCLKNKLEAQTGLKFDLEIVSDEGAFISSEKFNSSLEVVLGEPKVVSVYFPPRKGYFEYAFVHALDEYVEGECLVPGYAKKKWSDLSFFYRLFFR